MPAYAIDVPKRSVRVFASHAEAMNTADVGEQVIQSAASLAQQAAYDHADLVAFYRAVFRDNVSQFPEKRDVAQAIFANLPSLFGGSPLESLSVNRKRAAFASSESNPFQESSMSDLNGALNNPLSPVETASVSPIGLEVRETAPAVVTADVSDVPHTAVEMALPVAAPIASPETFTPAPAPAPVPTPEAVAHSAQDVVIEWGGQEIGRGETSAEVLPAEEDDAANNADADAASEPETGPVQEPDPFVWGAREVEEINRGRAANDRLVSAALSKALDAIARYRDAAAEEQAQAETVAARIAEVQDRYTKLGNQVLASLRASRDRVETVRLRRELSELVTREAEELRPLRQTQDGAGPAKTRKIAAEKEIARLASGVVQASRDAALLAHAAVARIEALAYRTAEELAPPVAKRRGRPANPSAVSSRREGERRGRKSARQGKTLRVAEGVDLNPAHPQSRRAASFRVVAENPGVSYERYLELGGDPSDLGGFLSAGTITMND